MSASLILFRLLPPPPPPQDGLVIVSGDGLIYEAINGLMARQDGPAAILALPIGVIPAGSGNALAKQLTHTAGPPRPPAPSRLTL